MLEALREVHEAQLAQLEEERNKLVDDHNSVLATAEDRIKEQHDLLHDYKQTIEDLRAELKGSTSREQATARDAAKQGTELK